jgi:hypothetical protein
MLTAQEILKEYTNCVLDPIYTIETYFKTFDKTNNGFVPFYLFEKQKEIVESYDKYRFNLVAKPRQAGVSTTTAAYLAVKVAFADKDNPEAILIVANKQDMAFEFLAKIKDFLNQIPRWAWGSDYYGTPEKERKSIFISDSKKEIKLPNGCRVKAVATSKDALRGYTPTYLIMDEAAFIEDGKELFGAALTALGTGGHASLISCVTEDTFIQTDRGLRQISDFIDYSQPDDPMHSYIIDEYGVLGNVGIRHSNLFVNNGLQDTVKIVTRHSMLEGTKPHKVWGYKRATNEYKWLKLEDISVGDFITVKFGDMVFGNDDSLSIDDYTFSNKEKKPKILYDKITEDLAYLIGLYLAEGCTYKVFNKHGKHIGTNITITCGDYIGDAITRCGFNYSCHDNLHYTISSKYLGAILESVGLDLSLKAKDKFISTKLLSLSLENTRAMIRGFMDGDGFSDAMRGRIGLSISSKKLCLQLRQLLLNFGVLTDYVEGESDITDLVSVKSKYYRLSATSNNAKKYFDEIGFSFERKQIKENAIKEKSPNHRYNIIPNGKQILRKIIDDNNLKNSFRGSGLKLSSLRLDKSLTGDLSKPTFIKFIQYIKSLNVNIDSYGIDKILISDSIWVPILSMEIGKAKTYDFSLANNPDDFWCHSVLYNGILGHQTPNGQDPLYYETYDLAIKKKNNFNIIEMRWYQDNRYNKDLSWYKYKDKEKTEKEEIKETEFTFESYERFIKDGYKPTSSWYEEMCRGMNNDTRMIAQELDVSFLGSGGNVVSDEYIQHHKANNVENPKFVSGEDNELWVWEEPIDGHEYILASDVSRGDGEDSSTFVVIDFTTMTQVVEFQGKVPPDKLADILYEYGMLYNALVVVDITGGMGVATILKLQEMKYPNLYYDDKGKALKQRKDIGKYDTKKETAGFQVGTDRTRLVAHFEKMVRINRDEGLDHGIKIRSERLISELNTFVYINGRADHAKGKHDDIIMAMAMALFVLEYSFKQLKQLKTKTKSMLASWVVNSGNEVHNMQREMTVSSNKPEPKKPNFKPQVAKNMQDPQGQYMWLFSGYR